MCFNCFSSYLEYSRWGNGLQHLRKYIVLWTWNVPLCISSSGNVFSTSWMDWKWWGENICTYSNSIFSRNGYGSCCCCSNPNNCCWINWLLNFRIKRPLLCNLHFRFRSCSWWDFRWYRNYRSWTRFYNSTFPRCRKLRSKRWILLLLEFHGSCFDFYYSQINLFNKI